MISLEAAKQEIEKLLSKNRYTAMVETVAIITELLQPFDVKPVIVGGLAVEIYTRNQYVTQDIDLIISHRELAKEILNQLGFSRHGRHWLHPIIDISIEIPNEALEDADEDKITEIELPSGRYVYVIGLEDIILDRVRACIHWKSSSDCEWGFRMLKLHYDSLDLEYILKQAEKDSPKTLGLINEWLLSI